MGDYIDFNKDVYGTSDDDETECYKLGGGEDDE